MDVVWRCLHSCWPFKFNFVANAKNNPDLYGPFWVLLPQSFNPFYFPLMACFSQVTTTLIFMMAAAGNFAQYLGNSVSTSSSLPL